MRDNQTERAVQRVKTDAAALTSVSSLKIVYEKSGADLNGTVEITKCDVDLNGTVESTGLFQMMENIELSEIEDKCDKARGVATQHAASPWLPTLAAPRFTSAITPRCPRWLPIRAALRLTSTSATILISVDRKSVV